MAAKLEVNRRGVWLGKLRLAAFVEDAHGCATKYVVADGKHDPSKHYEEPEDCRWDAESEVRRLLREAGIEVVP
jgi:hypothetical protein